jgi:NADPH:quinone reductase-like Zn-dependent oxidoreductase
MPSPSPHQIVIKTKAIGINPADAAVQNVGLVYSADLHPVILGFDIAGEVHAVGEEVTRFKLGDRVCAFPIDMGGHEVESKLAHGAFQLYCVSNASLAAVVPDTSRSAKQQCFPRVSQPQLGPCSTKRPWPSRSPPSKAVQPPTAKSSSSGAAPPS